MALITVVKDPEVMLTASDLRNLEDVCSSYTTKHLFLRHGKVKITA
jgi:hypothetical protein